MLPRLRGDTKLAPERAGADDQHQHDQHDRRAAAADQPGDPLAALGPRDRRGGGHDPPRSRWTYTATTMMTAWIIRATESGRSFWMIVAVISCISSAPIRVPSTRTWPPASGVPPITTAVIALSSMSSPTNDGSLAPSRAVLTTPATAASSPEST